MLSILYQILIGSLLVPVTILVQVAFIQVAIKRLQSLEKKEVKLKTLTITGILSASTLWMLAALSTAIWMWALFFLKLNAFENLEESLYFSMVAFTTLGFGDLILPDQWRILSGVVAANGLILFGLTTAFLFAVLVRILQAKDS